MVSFGRTPKSWDQGGCGCPSGRRWTVQKNKLGTPHLSRATAAFLLFSFQHRPYTGRRPHGTRVTAHKGTTEETNVAVFRIEKILRIDRDGCASFSFSFVPNILRFLHTSTATPDVEKSPWDTKKWDGRRIITIRKRRKGAESRYELLAQCTPAISHVARMYKDKPVLDMCLTSLFAFAFFLDLLIASFWVYLLQRLSSLSCLLSNTILVDACRTKVF